MATAKNYKPEGSHDLLPHITVKDCAKAIDYYKKVFGATEVNRMEGPGGGIMHAHLRFGDSGLMLNDEFPEMGAKGPLTIGGTPVTLTLYVKDVDKIVNDAVAAGAKSALPVADMFWGDRYGRITDPFGHDWEIMTHKEDLTPEEMRERGEKAMAEMRQG
jgi:uncharacterized glyoxalase superfamily protein PhnB